MQKYPHKYAFPSRDICLQHIVHIGELFTLSRRSGSGAAINAAPR